VGANLFVLLVIVVENLQLAHPVHHRHKTDDHKNPVNGVGTPPAVHKAEKIQWCEKVVYK